MLGEEISTEGPTNIYTQGYWNDVMLFMGQFNIEVNNE